MENIEGMIHEVRGAQIIIDRDLAKLYGVETKALNQAVKRNIERFPEDFMFRLTKDECLRSQIVTLNTGQGEHLKYMPYAFTENGVAMLSGVLKSETAVAVNIRIMRTFTTLRKTVIHHEDLAVRVEALEFNQLKLSRNQALQESSFEQKINDIMNLLEHKSNIPIEGIFYDGQIFDAYVFATDLIRSARTRLVLIDNYVDESVLLMLSKRSDGVSAEIRTGRLPQQFQLDLEKHNSQYAPISIVQSRNIHDRFLIVDDTVFHLGASLKDLGKKLFAFSKMSLPPSTIL